MLGPARKKPLISHSPQPNRNFVQESSPSKGSTLFKSDCSQYVNGLKAKKQNYSTALGLYTACYENEIPQKCLKHLNFITLYCVDQHKLLCVNCLYGSTAHKTHSVVPSNSSLTDIKRDNEASLRAIDDDIKDIKDSQAKVIENRRIIQSQSNFILQQITKQFNQIRKMIDVKEKQLKQRTLRQFDRAGYENDITRKQIGWWKQEMQKIRSGLPRDSNSQDPEIYKHLVLELMLGEQLQTQKLTYIASKDQMEHQFLTEARELKETVKSKIYQGSRSNQLKLF